MNNPISQKVIDKIKKEKIVPRSKWRFLLLRLAILFLVIICVVFGAISFGIIWDILLEFETSKIIKRPGGIGILFSNFPYFWLIFSSIFLILAILEFLRSKYGYKYKLRYVVLSFIAFVIFSGLILSFFRFSGEAEKYARDYIPAYKFMNNSPEKFWSQPQLGFLSGTIISNDENCRCLRLVDWKENYWEVDYSEATIRSRIEKNKGEAIKIIGERKNENNFKAEEIRPWRGRKANFHNQKSNQNYFWKE